MLFSIKFRTTTCTWDMGRKRYKNTFQSVKYLIYLRNLCYIFNNRYWIVIYRACSLFTYLTYDVLRFVLLILIDKTITYRMCNLRLKKTLWVWRVDNTYIHEQCEKETDKWKINSIFLMTLKTLQCGIKCIHSDIYVSYKNT